MRRDSFGIDGRAVRRRGPPVTTSEVGVVRTKVHREMQDTPLTTSSRCFFLRITYEIAVICTPCHPGSSGAPGRPWR